MFLSGVWHDIDGLIMDGGGCFGFLGEVVFNYSWCRWDWGRRQEGYLIQHLDVARKRDMRESLGGRGYTCRQVTKPQHYYW